jgi:uncharacterized membrane protein
MHVRRAVTVRRPVEEVYRYWRDFQNLPGFMDHLHAVHATIEKRSRWVAVTPTGAIVEWDVELVADVPNERIAWQSAEDADVSCTGDVHFRTAPGGRGTEVEVELSYDAPPGGKIGRLVAKLFGKDPGQQVERDLRRFKQVLETGEVLVSDATLAAKGAAQRPAQPREQARQLEPALR